MMLTGNNDQNETRGSYDDAMLDETSSIGSLSLESYQGREDTYYCRQGCPISSSVLEYHEELNKQQRERQLQPPSTVFARNKHSTACVILNMSLLINENKQQERDHRPQKQKKPKSFRKAKSCENFMATPKDRWDSGITHKSSLGLPTSHRRSYPTDQKKRHSMDNPMAVAFETKHLPWPLAIVEKSTTNAMPATIHASSLDLLESEMGRLAPFHNITRNPQLPTVFHQQGNNMLCPMLTNHENHHQRHPQNQKDFLQGVLDSVFEMTTK